jgi:hypothetical protein
MIHPSIHFSSAEPEPATLGFCPGSPDLDLRGSASGSAWLAAACKSLILLPSHFFTKWLGWLGGLKMTWLAAARNPLILLPSHFARKYPRRATNWLGVVTIPGQVYQVRAPSARKPTAPSIQPPEITLTNINPTW